MPDDACKAAVLLLPGTPKSLSIGMEDFVHMIVLELLFADGIGNNSQGVN